MVLHATKTVTIYKMRSWTQERTRSEVYLKIDDNRKLETAIIHELRTSTQRKLKLHYKGYLLDQFADATTNRSIFNGYSTCDSVKLRIKTYISWQRKVNQQGKRLEEKCVSIKLRICSHGPKFSVCVLVTRPLCGLAVKALRGMPPTLLNRPV